MFDIYLNKIGRECEQELHSIGIPCGNIALYEPSEDTSWGLCQQYGNWFIISINSILIKRKYEDGLRNTIIHELLHSCPGCYDHGLEWQKQANIVMKNFGYLIKPTDSYKEKGIDLYEYANSGAFKYTIQCSECGVIYFRKRKSKFVKNYNSYRCGKCGGKLKQIIPEE